MYNKEEKKYNSVTSIRWKVGAHTQFLSNIHNTLKQSISYGMNVTQFFLGNPRSFKRHQANAQDIEKCKKLLKRFPMCVISHFPYIANFCGSVKQLAWSGNKQQDWKTQNIIDALEYELNILSNFSGYVVIHPGNFKDRKVGLQNIAKSLNKVHYTKGSTLLLENAAGKGCSLATTFEEIKEIIDLIESKKQEFIGVCLDTAHICGYGEYDLSKCSEVSRMFEEFNKIIGIQHLKLLHLNDSVVPLGSKKDRHAMLGTGQIWGKSFDSLVLLLDICQKYNIPAVLETHVTDMLTLGALSDYKNIC